MSSAPKRPKLIKKCAYMGCDSAEHEDGRRGSIKFFHFPQNYRCKVWAKLSGMLNSCY